MTTRPTARKAGESLVIENELIRREFSWNNGNLVSTSVVDRTRKLTMELPQGEVADLRLEGESDAVTDGRLEVQWVEQSPITLAHLEAVVETRIGDLNVRRTFSVFPDVPAITSRFSFRGHAAAERWLGAVVRPGDGRSRAARAVLASAPSIDRMPMTGRHSRVTAVELLDATDYNNNLVHSWEVLPYRQPLGLSATILLCRESFGRAGLFVIKEAPLSDAQTAYPGVDFDCTQQEIRVLGPGIEPTDIDDEWQDCYACTVGVAAPTDLAMLSALKGYLATKRRMIGGRDSTIMLNTWGDRGQDRRIGERFATAEIESGARLGVSHFQLDDGWEKGRSSNSAIPGGSLEGIWERDGFWEVNPERFPNGLAPVAEKARETGVELCIWFNPSADNDYAHWRDDAEVLIELNRKHGIRTFKIDGVMIPTRKAERNFLHMLDAVMQAADGNAVFNLDVTAGRRLGYVYANRYGNLFLENRYTDAVSYYPHWTLRNLWQLSRWLAPQSFQVEFLNRWRNAEKYPEDDPLAPSRIPFDYCFAVTMAAQPLAWFEASGLPEEAFDMQATVLRYRELQPDLHAGIILPVGEEPSGTSWTGFQSMHDGRGYLLIYREYTERPSSPVRLWGVNAKRLRLASEAGHGKDFTGAVDENGCLVFELPDRHSWGLYSYEVIAE